MMGCRPTVELSRLLMVLLKRESIRTRKPCEMAAIQQAGYSAMLGHLAHRLNRDSEIMDRNLSPGR
jgi:ornithine carbamoyltransferase